MNNEKLLETLGSLRLEMREFWIKRRDSDDHLRQLQSKIDGLWREAVREQELMDAYYTKKEENNAA